MRYIPAGLQTMLNGTEITPALCLKITGKNGSVVAFTTHDADLTFGSVTYKAKKSFSMGSIKWSNRIEEQLTTITGVIDQDFLGSTIIADDIRTGLYIGAPFILYLVDWTNTANRTVLKEGKIASIYPEGTQYTADLRDMMSPLVKTPLVQPVSVACSAELGDTRCGYTREQDTGTIDDFNSYYELIDSTFAWSGSGDPEVQLVGGEFYFTTGDYTWFRNQVKSYDNATKTFTFVRPFPQTPSEPFWNFVVFEGCPKTASACLDRFNNMANFRGFPHVPTKDKLYKNNYAGAGDGTGYTVGDGGDD